MRTSNFDLVVIYDGHDVHSIVDQSASAHTFMSNRLIAIFSRSPFLTGYKAARLFLLVDLENGNIRDY